MKTLEPDAAAHQIVDPAVRRRVIELLVTLELCRHPQTETQINRVESYAAAFEIDGPALEIVRRWIDDGAERATEDYDRFYAEDLPQLSEPDLRADYLVLTEPDPELARRLELLHDLPADTLGHWYVEFYRRNHLVLPGADTHLPAHYVSHDMNHVITGYEPTGPGEIALGAFTLAMNDNDANWLQFMTNLLIHEAGMLKHGEILPRAESLERPGATELLGEALATRRALYFGFQPDRSPLHRELAARRRPRPLQRRGPRDADVLSGTARETRCLASATLAIQTPLRLNVTCVTPLGEEVASIS